MKRTHMLSALAAGAMAISPVMAIANPDTNTPPAENATAEMSKGEQRLAKALEGRVAGEPVRCLSMNQIQESRIYDDTAIVYRVGRTLYVNRPDSGARALDRSDIMVTESTIGRLCSIDTVRMVDNAGFMRGVVFLGEFVPYDKPEKG